MRILVTGGAGFIGSHLVDALLAAGHDVAVLDNYRTGSINNLRAAAWHTGADGPRTRVFTGSVCWEPDVERVMLAVEPEVVFHLAAQVDVRESVRNPINDMQINLNGTVTMLEAAQRRGVQRFVFVSSAAVFGDQVITKLGRHWTAMQPAPISPYGASKAAAELYVDLYGNGGTVSTCTVVFSNVYGPRQRADRGAVNIFARALLAGEPVTLFGDGRNIRDYLYVDDAVAALVRAGGCHLDGQQYPRVLGRLLVGTGVGTTDRDLLKIVATEVALQTGQSMLDRDRAQTADVRDYDIRNSTFPEGRLGKVELRDGVRRTVEAIRKELGK